MLKPNFKSAHKEALDSLLLKMPGVVAGKTVAVTALAILVFFTFSPPCAADNFQSDSKRFGNPKMDIVITEIDRRPRSSVLDIKVNAVGSSVGSSFFIVCSLRDLANSGAVSGTSSRLRRGPGAVRCWWAF